MGFFCFQTMSFGLSGAAINFQKAMNNILQLLHFKGVLVYLDDIILMAATFDDYLKLLRKVFTLLRDDGITVKLEKCKFLKRLKKG